MGFFDKLFRGRDAPEALARPQAATGPGSTGQVFNGLDDPELLEFIRRGQSSSSSIRMLRNMAALRCLSLISNGLGMLPTNLYHAGEEKRVATDHPAHRLLRLKPNPWQTPMEFKSQMQLLLESEGNAYARIIRAAGRPIHLIPFERGRVQAKLGSNWRMQYQCTTEHGGQLTLDQEDMFHVRDMSLDGVEGISRRRLSKEVFELADQAGRAARNVFRTGVMAGGALEVPQALSDQAYSRLKESLAYEYSGADNANKWMIAEEGAKANKFTSTPAEAQQVETRNHQIEEVARLYGVPRPLLMMDDTSWGSGIEQLAIFFVQYTLAPRFVAWEQAAARSLLTDRELGHYYYKFNERALMRGTLKDQADYFAKALGAGGHQPWHTANEVRDLADYPADPNAKFDTLGEPTGKKASNESEKTT
ncbi:phage portal protein [Corticibacter populi]|uniref:Phage portal protein n=1 Tax=Corticibacter populi TaxID=1550736 RepID=A0A3M6QV03_9BURK|nr:phage portal protein [Corticibacter populi]RMX06721.1 phage portal protein [Corticibacter populi]RZS31698.1 HK97 family phage portal protein [Corticibacter populi]